MESLNDFAERFRRDVQKKCGCSVFTTLLKSPPDRYSIYKYENQTRKVFAWVDKKVSYDRFDIESCEEWVITAGVNISFNKRAPNGCFSHGKASLFWYIQEDDNKRYSEIVEIFSKICKSR